MPTLGLDIELRQSKYLNNIVEQDHRAAKRITNPMMGFKSFWSAQKLIAAIETMHMVEEGAVALPRGSSHVRSQAVLQPGILIFNDQRSFVGPVNAIATQPLGGRLQK